MNGKRHVLLKSQKGVYIRNSQYIKSTVCLIIESTDQIQVQVQMGETRRVFLMTSPRTYNDLTEAIRREIPKSRALTFGLLYENYEKEFVVMNNDPICFRIAISGVKCIPGLLTKCKGKS